MGGGKTGRGRCVWGGTPYTEISDGYLQVWLAQLVTLRFIDCVTRSYPGSFFLCLWCGTIGSEEHSDGNRNKSNVGRMVGGKTGRSVAAAGFGAGDFVGADAEE